MVDIDELDLGPIEDEYHRQGLNDVNESFESWVRDSLRERLYSLGDEREMAARLGDTDRLLSDLKHQREFYQNLLDEASSDD